MSTGDTLGTLIQEVQYELSQVVTPAAGQNFREHIKARINREYRRLYHDHNWRHLRQWNDKTLTPGQRYYDYPTGVTLETVIDVYIKWGTQFTPITDDLSPMHYNGLNSDNGVRADPVQRWRPYGPNQIEVWPIPATATFLRFESKKPFAPMVDEGDRCDLDTDLVVLYAAGKLAVRTNEKEAARLLAEAKDHYDTLKLRGHSKTRVNMGEPRIHEGYQRGFKNKIIVGVERG